MSKKTSRSIALGLFVSGLIVLGLDVWGADLTGITQTGGPYAVTESLSELEEKVTALEEENSRLIDEHDRLTEGYASSLTLSDIQESGQADDANVTTSSENAETTEDQYTVTVREGEPSSVIAEQLETLGVIEDRLAFNDYLEKNDYAKKVRPGNFVVSTDMSTDELVQAIIR